MICQRLARKKVWLACKFTAVLNLDLDLGSRNEPVKEFENRSSFDNLELLTYEIIENMTEFRNSFTLAYFFGPPCSL